jgi:hypothetical protein
MHRIPTRLGTAAIVVCALATRGVFAGAHTWKVNEVFSNADGTIQFVELRESGGGTGEIGTGGHILSSSTVNYTIPSNMVSPTSFKTILFGTPAFATLFAKLPGNPAPDFVFPAGSVPFFDAAAGSSLAYNPFDIWAIPAATIPTDGVNSYNRASGVAANTPTNYAGQGGTINANPPQPPGVPDGNNAGTTPMTIQSTDPTGSSIALNWDVASCSGGSGFHLIYGGRSNLPSAPGGAYALAGGVCGITATMPFVWNGVPAPDASRLLWWMVVADDAVATEGPWGHGSDGIERVGPGPGGSSAVCSMTAKTTANVCGH